MKLLGIILILLISIVPCSADEFCRKLYPDSLQMQDYCDDRQEKYLYTVATAYDLLKNNTDAKQRIEHCAFMFSKDSLVDWELVYMCLLTIE